ncbi:hypothetical protein EJ06DRAFT_90173 [Trichodelitschia bisporula]|uniref:Uncharacterized protein n=1 Tax=Trichodelitschia bisporula TaxID=703511 RepID=A0A6G1HRQ3_9PEZI|nr:hypothetical protein EJ06DRAFT_90173 [Trichodelitschia bisporula]
MHWNNLEGLWPNLLRVNRVIRVENAFTVSESIFSHWSPSKQYLSVNSQVQLERAKLIAIPFSSTAAKALPSRPTRTNLLEASNIRSMAKLGGAYLPPPPHQSTNQQTAKVITQVLTTAARVRLTQRPPARIYFKPAARVRAPQALRHRRRPVPIVSAVSAADFAHKRRRIQRLRFPGFHKQPGVCRNSVFRNAVAAAWPSVRTATALLPASAVQGPEREKLSRADCVMLLWLI